jgi:hypothetical protein
MHLRLVARYDFHSQRDFMRILFLILSFLLATASVAQAATVNVVPDAAIVGPNSVFSVLVGGTSFPETGGATLGLSFDPSVVNVTGVFLATGSPFDFVSSSAFDNVTGGVKFISVLAPVAGALPSGDFSALRIDFMSVGLGAANITLSEDGVLTGWSAATGAVIPGVTYNQASVTVSTVPLPAAAWLLLSGLGTVVSVTRRRRDVRQ